MDNIINKPRVFLSHSSKDKDFINKLDIDLRRCHIDTWLDTYEMRAGRSWLKMIFESGIPTCNAVIVYLTDNSIDSKIVEKEMDSALIENMSEKGITFLPYVSKAGLRKKLRIDIQTLHCIEWNSENYSEILPIVVSEIWHSYLETSVNNALTQEKNKRLESELKLKKFQENQKAVFSDIEEKEFQYIYSNLNNVVISFEHGSWSFDKDKYVIMDIFNVPLLGLIIYYLKQDNKRLSQDYLINVFQNYLRDNQIFASLSSLFVKERFLVKLRVFGLTTDDTDADLFTKKIYRFHYWLEFNKLIPDELAIEHLSIKEPSS